MQEIIDTLGKKVSEYQSKYEKEKEKVLQMEKEFETMSQKYVEANGYFTLSKKKVVDLEEYNEDLENKLRITNHKNTDLEATYEKVLEELLIIKSTQNYNDCSSSSKRSMSSKRSTQKNEERLDKKTRTENVNLKKRNIEHYDTNTVAVQTDDYLNSGVFSPFSSPEIKLNSTTNISLKNINPFLNSSGSSKQAVKITDFANMNERKTFREFNNINDNFIANNLHKDNSKESNANLNKDKTNEFNPKINIVHNGMTYINQKIIQNLNNEYFPTNFNTKVQNSNNTQNNVNQMGTNQDLHMDMTKLINHLSKSIVSANDDKLNASVKHENLSFAAKNENIFNKQTASFGEVFMKTSQESNLAKSYDNENKPINEIDNVT